MEREIQKILVALDLTEEADEVLATAASMAKANDAEVTVVTVVKPLASAYGGLDMAPISSGNVAFEREAVEQAKKQLTQLAEAYDIQGDDVHALLGHPPTEIRDLAQATGVNLIVIGTHGRHGLGLLLGSTANAVLHGVPCDVLAVKIHPMEVS